jgi:predicted Zn-dependent protease
MKTALKLLIVLFIAAGFTSLLGGCASDRAVVQQANEVDQTLEKAVIHDPQIESYFQRLGARILNGAKAYDPENASKSENAWMYKDLQLHLVNSKTLNAFTTGGNHMYIYNQLFQDAKSEDELAAVMSHEYAHINRRHVQQGMNRQYALMGVAAAAGAAGYGLGGKEKGSEYAGIGAGVGGVAAQFIGMGYTRKDEAQADEYGFHFYSKAGWDPNRFGDFFQSMIDKGYDKGPDYLSDHPSLKSRLDLARQRARQLPSNADQWRRPPIASDTEFRRLQERAREIGTHTPTDESLKQVQKLLTAMPRSCLTPAIRPDQKEAEEELLHDLEKAKKNNKNKRNEREASRGERGSEVISAR